MEDMESWKEFLNKQVRVIIDDKPSPIPKHKDGIFTGINKTHLILNNKEALLLSNVRRVEIKGDNNGI